MLQWIPQASLNPSGSVIADASGVVLLNIELIAVAWTGGYLNLRYTAYQVDDRIHKIIRLTLVGSFSS